MNRLAIDLQKTAQLGAKFLYIVTLLFILLGVYVHPYFHIGAVLAGGLALVNLYFKHVQTHHALLRNFGLLAMARYIFESIGPEMRQYFYLSDTEERPFNRTERSEVYQKSKDVDSTNAFGSQMEFNHHEIKLRHSMYPMLNDEVAPFEVTFGEERKCKNAYTITKPMIISAMSFGALGSHAVSALSLGAKKAGIPMNTGEGGLSLYHLSGGCDIIFQMGTAKFGCRNNDGSLNEKKLKDICKHKEVKMVEIKFSQGAKPGKGGLLPKEKITEEIARIRHVPIGKDVISPERHVECDTTKNTVKFIRRVQRVSGLPVGIKFCVGNPEEIRALFKEMKKQKIYPDYISIDGGEGGTGASPKSFMDIVGMPLFQALDTVTGMMRKEKVRNKMKVLCAGKLINAGKQIQALAHGADACYTARGFMMSIGCIQAMQCNKGTCPVGVTTHDPVLQRGIVIPEKAERVANYVKNTNKEFIELIAAMGVKSAKDLSCKQLYEQKHVTKEV
ncbi:MAG: FMN-binding glutamate synthase family protein [Candidatus Nanoarchaeia archaeon]